MQDKENNSGREAPPLKITNLSVLYHGGPALINVNYISPHQGLIAIVGPNGAGKSTLLKACLGLIPIQSGTVEFYGEDLSYQRQRISYVPQREDVDWDFPISALEVTAMGRYSKIGWFKPVSRQHREKARECLERVGMSAFENRPIGELSGGQQQRVFIARAIAQEADMYLMDEPFSGIDAITEEILINTLKELEHAGKVVFCVHHDLNTVGQYFTDILLLNRHVIQAGPLKTALNDKTLYQTYRSF